MASSALPARSLSWAGMGFALSTASLFSLVPYLTTVILNEGVAPLELLLIRYGLSGIIIVLATCLDKPALLRISLRNLGLCLLCGVLYFASTWAYTAAFTYIHTSIAAILVSIYPLLVFLLLALRGEKLTWRNSVRLALGLSGIYLVIGPGGSVNLMGVLLVFTSALSYALYLVLMQWFLKAVPAKSITLYVTLTITFCLGVGWLLKGAPVSSMTMSIWLPMLFLVIGCTFLAQLFLFRAVNLMGSAQIALLSPLETLLALTWSALFLRENLSFLQMLGSSLILISMFLAVFRLKEVKRLWRTIARLRL